MDRLSSDLRYAVRVLVRAPMFTTIAVIMLALGIGAATAVYAVVDGVLLRPFTYPHMQRLAILTERGGNGQFMSVAWPTFLDWRSMNDLFDELGVYRAATVTLTGGQEPERLTGSVVSASIFTSMGIPPLAGRVFGDADDAPDANGAADPEVVEPAGSARAKRPPRAKRSTLGSPIPYRG